MLLRSGIFIAAFLCSLSSYAASGLKGVELRDLYFGEVLFYAYQDKYFEALERLDSELIQYYRVDESNLDPLSLNLGQAEFSVGDIELQYRMDKRAGKAIQAVLGRGIDLATRNLAALDLARMYFRKNDAERALYALDLIHDEVDMTKYPDKSVEDLRGVEPENFKVDVLYLRALAYISTGQFSNAVDILDSLRNEASIKGYVLYNLGIALIQAQQELPGLEVLDELGRLETRDKALLALKDKVNLKIAYRLLDSANAEQARLYFQRIRLDGPYSNQALLGAGWAEAALDRYDRALVPWTILHKREKTNHSVQEALMAVPYAYGKLQAYGKSANMYAEAMDMYVYEISRLDDSIKAIRGGKFLEALVDEETGQDENWVVNLRELPDAPETRYMLDLLASSDFQTSYNNYRDLADLKIRIETWLADLKVFEEIIDIRRAYQEPLLPIVGDRFEKIDARAKLRLEQRNSLAGKIKNILIAPRPDFLATADERLALDRITAFEHYIAEYPAKVTDDQVYRVKRLRGVLSWRLQSEYDQRLTDAYNHLLSLDETTKAFKKQYSSFIRTRQAATQSYEGYQPVIRRLRTGLLAAQRKLKGVMAKQGRFLETMAENELDRRRKRLEDYQIKARFALAENYDRVSGADQDKLIEEQNQLREERLKQLELEKEARKTEEKAPSAGDSLDKDSSILNNIPSN
ncbi:MAG: hypothetical protein OEY09_07880 [Gammaproteobacteria bacterium]|nr:hypothetical protein [Gammaproteobacteria bacterium]